MGLDNPIHLIVLLLILLLVFGAKRLPEIGRSLGEGMRGFKDSLSGTETTTTAQAPSAPLTPPPPAPVAAAPPQPVATAAPAEPAGE